MSKPRKTKRALPAKTDTEREQYDAYLWLKTELQKADAWDAAARMRELAEKTSSEPLRGFCIKALMEYDLKLRLLNAGSPADSSITVIVQPWAAVPKMSGTPRPAIDVTANDHEGRAHSSLSMPASPDVPNAAAIDARHAPGAEVYEMERGADGLEHAAPVRDEQPAPDEEHWETLIDNATGTPIKVRIHA